MSIKIRGTNPRTGKVEEFEADDERMAKRMVGNLIVRGLKDVKIVK